MTAARIAGERRPALRVAVHLDGAAINGNERQVLLLAEQLRTRGHEVVVSCRAGGPVWSAFERLGIRTTAIRPRGDLDVWSTLRFAAWLREERPDVLLLTSWRRLFSATIAARWAGVPRTIMRMGGPHSIPQGRLARWKYASSLQRVDALIANSRGLHRQIVEMLPSFRQETVYRVPNAVAVADAAPAPIRRELGLGEHEVLVIGVGGLERHKGFDLLVDAVARLRRPDVYLLLAGSGSQREALQARAQRLGIGERVHLLGRRPDVPALLAASEVFVLSSRVDSMANVMLEAMHAGPLVVAADVPGTRDALAPWHGRPPAGWIVPVGEVEPLARALGEAVHAARTHVPEAEARRREARFRAQQWFRIEHTVEEAEAALYGERDRGGAGPPPARSA